MTITAAADTSSIVSIDGREVARFYVNPYGGGYRLKMHGEVRTFGRTANPAAYKQMMAYIQSHA